MAKTLYTILCLLVLANPANAQLYASPAGNDANPCSQTARCSLQGIINKSSAAMISLAPGVYPPFQVYYYQAINIIGEGANPSDVIIRGNAPGINVVSAQDHCILGLTNLQIDTVASGSNGVLSRQFCIVDLVNVVFGAFPNGNMVIAIDGGILSLTGNTYVSGGAASFVANIAGRVNVGGTINVASGLIFSVAFFSAIDGGRINASGGVITGPGGGPYTTGKQWVVDDGTLRLPAPYVVPGSISGTTAHNGQAY